MGTRHDFGLPRLCRTRGSGNHDVFSPVQYSLLTSACCTWQPGTYDALSHMLFKPLPSPGSSGGPIVDEESGAVVGVMLGTRMDNRVEGLRGWGVPSETIFEVCLTLFRPEGSSYMGVCADVWPAGTSAQTMMISTRLVSYHT